MFNYFQYCKRTTRHQYGNYKVDGNGRDSYIYTDNGGFNRDHTNEKRDQGALIITKYS